MEQLRGAFLALVALASVSALLAPPAWEVKAAEEKAPHWIWFDEGDPTKSAPAETRYFRKTFEIEAPFADEATLEVTADNKFKAWFNGVEIGTGNDWKRFYKFDVKKHYLQGKNVLAVEAHNNDGPAGLVVRLDHVPNGRSRTAEYSDATWKCSKTAAEGWQKLDFDDAKWSSVKVLGLYGKTAPWSKVAAPPGTGRFTEPEGFKVLPAVKDPYAELTGPKKKPFSLVNMCFDAKGRLLVSEEGGPILICTNPDKEGVFQDVKPYCEIVKNCHGMCWVDDALYLVGNGPVGDGPKKRTTAGLFRCRDTKGADKIDEATLLHAFQGGMGEHGPHAIIHGPDNHLYVVIGNHAHAQVDGKQATLSAHSPLKRWPTGLMGPDQGKPGTTEDVLLPRQNDAGGHAHNILAPGGTVWRFDKDFKTMSLFSAGYRNHFDAAFSPTGEMFTFDSDMEWDENLPWYRPVRVCHVTPGSDFVWRTGAANTPEYYVDSLPAAVNVGRGSPVGMDFYDHPAFPAKYRGCCFMGDWSLGIIYAIHLKRDGATYKAEAEKFCTGNPLNVTDLAVAPDGSVYFTMGGRGSQGGVYRIVSTKLLPEPEEAALLVQPLSAWGRVRNQKLIDGWVAKDGKDATLKKLHDSLRKNALEPQAPWEAPNRVRLLTVLQNHGFVPDAALLLWLLDSKSPEIRAAAIYFLGVNGYKEGKDALVKALKDPDKLVQRRACEALIRAGFEPPLEELWPLLADNDRFVRTAARLVLERINPANWTAKLWAEKNDRVAWEGIITLCHVNKASPRTTSVLARLRKGTATCDDPEAMLDWLRTVQLALIHTAGNAEEIKPMAARCLKMFPAEDKMVCREMAIVLAHCRKEGIIDEPVHTALLKALLAAKGDRQQQIHYFYCLRVLHQGWTAEQKDELLAWFGSTDGWTGGYSYLGFLDNILRDLNPVFEASDRERALARAEQLPKAAAAMLRLAPQAQVPTVSTLVKAYERLADAKPTPVGKELKAQIIGALGLCKDAEAEAAVRKIGDKDPGQAEAVAKALLHSPTEQNWPYLVRGLQSTNKLVLVELVETLKKSKTQPKKEDAAPYRAVLMAASRFDEKDRNRWKMVELLRHWGLKDFGGEPKDSKPELMALARWFAQSFPKEQTLPGTLTGKPAESKYKFDELLAFLEKDPEGKKGDVKRGRVVFEKAQCLKCHKYGKEGEGIGPDLSTVSKRFKRDYILESIIDPSKVISDQYRSSTIITKKGVTIVGLAAAQGDIVTVLQSDGTKVTLKKDEIEQQVASLVSVMPEKLLDPLTKQEIADLFAFLESEPK
jgi:putative heme-binding domain-containing protein